MPIKQFFLLIFRGVSIIIKNDFRYWKKYLQRNLLFIIIVSCLNGSQAVSADKPIMDPRMEIGFGLSGFQLQSRPEWAAKYYTTGLVTGAVRVYRGLGIQVGKEYGLGKEPSAEWLDYGENLRIKTNIGTSTEVSWFGVRYEIPMSTFHSDFMSIHSICASVGGMYTKYGVRSDIQEKDKIIEEDTTKQSYSIATVKGPYASLTARWRLDNEASKETGTWFGVYGIDFGVRYVRYSNSTMRRDTIIKPKSNFSCFQVFIIGFLKIKLLY